MTPKQLLDQFRREMDDRDPDPDGSADQSAFLWTDADILYFMDLAQQRFVYETRYLHNVLKLSVVAGDPVVKLPGRFIEPRGERAYLIESKTHVALWNLNELHGAADDYGRPVTTNPLDPGPPGRPRYAALDVEGTRSLHLIPASDIKDTLQLPAYLEAYPITNLENCELTVRKPRHIRVILHGMKAIAYGYHDSDAFNPEEEEKWEIRFRNGMLEVESEMKIRRRNAGVVQYGGI